MTTIHLFDHGAKINPNADYLIFGEQHISYQQAQQFTYQVANGLRSLGYQKNDRGAVWAANDPFAWLATLSLWRASMTWVPVNPRNTAEENGDLLDAFDCDVLFFQAAFAASIKQVLPRLSKIRHFICIDGEAPPGLPKTLSLEAWRSTQEQTPPPLECELDDVCILMATGGTTGKPKGVMNTHRNVQTMVAGWLSVFVYPESFCPVNIAAAPLTHSAGVISLMATIRGGTLVLLPRLDLDLLLDSIEMYSATELFLPPTVIYMLLERPDIEKRDFRSLRYFLYAAAPMAPEKLRRAIKTFGPVMIQGYGQTEALAGISYLSSEAHFKDGKVADDTRLSSCGRPFPFTSVAILNDQNEPVPDGEVGEICVRGDIVMKGYYKDPAKTAETIIAGWLHTGDVGFMDAEGYLHITDRKKDMIITGGFNVFSAEVESVIHAHPAVQDCVVFGVPDEKWGEAVKAVVERKAGAEINEETLLRFCKERLSGVKSPKSIDFMDRLPRSSVGKVLKREVRAIYWTGKTRQVN